MAETIYAGDDNVILQATIKEKGVVIDITGATIELNFRVKARTFTKQASVVDGVNGLCQTVLSSVDIADAGSYIFRGYVKFPDGVNVHSDKDYFNVEDATV